LLEFIVGIKFKKNDILTSIYWELLSQLDATLLLSIFFLIFFILHVGSPWKEARREKTKEPKVQMQMGREKAESVKGCVKPLCNIFAYPWLQKC